MYQNEGVKKADYLNDIDTPMGISKPVFAEILDQLKGEVMRASELSKEASNYCNALQLMPSPIEKKSPIPREEQGGIVGLFLQEIQKLSEANYTLSDCVNHLRKVIGN